MINKDGVLPFYFFQSFLLLFANLVSSAEIILTLIQLQNEVSPKFRITHKTKCMLNQVVSILPFAVLGSDLYTSCSVPIFICLLIVFVGLLTHPMGLITSFLYFFFLTSLSLSSNQYHSLFFLLGFLLIILAYLTF